MARIALGALGDFPERRGVAVELEGRRVAIFRLGDRVFAIDDRCPHRSFPLFDGTVDAGSVICRTHGSCFDLESGAVLRGPARRALRTYSTEIVDGQLIVEVV